MPKKVAVVGGGPKAAAICAKADCLRRAGIGIEVTVFEKSAWGAAWSGAHGYTDGRQRLCTPAERDVGFPYQVGLLTAEQTADLYARYSWGAYLVSAAGFGRSYLDWVNCGRLPPTHMDYAGYLGWVIENAAVERKHLEVTAIERSRGKWVLRTNDPATNRTARFAGFDGVVVSGPGAPRRGFDRPDDPRVTDGAAFWTDPDASLAQSEGSDDPIVIAGSGGTSAAIAAWIARAVRRPKPILIIGSQAALFTRSESFFENALFTDEEAWWAIPPAARREFTLRLNRGVVWANVSEELSNCADVRFVPGRVERLTISPAVDGAPAELTVEYRDFRGERSLPASIVIDASGFDAWWFAGLLPDDIKARITGPDAEGTWELRNQLTELMRSDLSLEIGFDGFHAPMLSQTQGPGFASLMVLGAMSDRILGPYRPGGLA